MSMLDIEYQDGDISCIGYARIPDSDAPRPEVLAVYAFDARHELACGYGDQYTELGCVGLTLDMYGARLLLRILMASQPI